jgi:hypothetical protein
MGLFMAVKGIAGQVGWGKAATGAASAYFGIEEYDRLRQEGHGVAGSFIGAAGDAALGMTAGIVPYMMLTGASGIGELGVNMATAYSQYSRDLQRQNLNIPFANSTFIDSPQIQTMRQAGLALARQSKMKTQEAMFGNEASYLHS